ncbi:hypothetical protein ACWI_34880 [Acetobacterium wieringae]|uniref:Uncharacterized protein n=1 Tax=Acetobacterium wieringae TaxID=52694 RepID=A0A1F2PDJ4_9FIRM|nr:hypothetical protein ACWI_34880 [Acetobacterium wieringae]
MQVAELLPYLKKTGMNSSNPYEVENTNHNPSDA